MSTRDHRHLPAVRLDRRRRHRRQGGRAAHQDRRARDERGDEEDDVTAWRTCPDCGADLYPRLARRSERGWVCADRRACADRRIAARQAGVEARIADIRFMAETDEHAEGAAQRLGITQDGLWKFCRTHGLDDAWQTLLARNPRDHNAACRGSAA